MMELLLPREENVTMRKITIRWKNQRKSSITKTGLNRKETIMLKRHRTAKSLQKVFLFGVPGSYTYDTLRLMGDSKIAAGAKVAGASLLPVIGPIILDQITITNYAKNKVKTTS